MRPIKKIILHCSDTETGNAKAIRKYHIEKKGFADIGYHYVIDRDGKIETGRDIEKIGAHCEGDNSDSIGICLIGKKQFEEIQFENLLELIFRLRERFGNIAIKGHYEMKSGIKQGKTCPNIDMDWYRTKWSLWN
ncbi:MAG TPA: N-acetylmuramoyl-L-alanine amidase [Spirochaetota bacterium]|nr:N-acetylmuramoyl-L-alanine amidase [Spirochaetota bacterium]